MKRLRTLQTIGIISLIGVGLYVLSYVHIRKSIALSALNRSGLLFVGIPYGSEKPWQWIYSPCMKMDQLITGKKVVFYAKKFRIGATATF